MQRAGDGKSQISLGKKRSLNALITKQFPKCAYNIRHVKTYL